MTCGYKESSDLIETARADAAEKGRYAIVLRLHTPTGVRYFSNWKVRLVTAWSIAGAKLFGMQDTYGLGTWEKRLQARGYWVERVIITATPVDTAGLT